MIPLSEERHFVPPRFLISPETLGQWNDYLTEFEKKAWPLFHHRGYSKDAALIAWFTNNVKNAVYDVDATLTGNEPPEQWKS